MARPFPFGAAKARRIHRRARELLSGTRSPLPFDMFDRERSSAELKAAYKLERLYHQGQRLAWDGKAVLQDLVARHGPVELDERSRKAVRRIFAVILWGELAAWKISAKLSDELEPLDAKLAATAQAHDEARHFYVMHDYLELVGELPRSLMPRTSQLLARVLDAPDTARMLLGMQLIIEPLALTLFSLVQQRKVEPVLDELMVYFERDEARHVALGVLYLPEVLRRLPLPKKAELAAWQLRSYLLQLDILKELEGDLVALGIDPREALRKARKKQIQATHLLAEELGRDLPITELFLRVVDFRSELDFPTGGNVRRGRRERWGAALKAALAGLEDDHGLGQGLGRAASGA